MAHLQARVKVRISDTVLINAQERQERTRLIQTTVGRALLSEILPPGLPFESINRDMTKKTISAVLNDCYRRVGSRSR